MTQVQSTPATHAEGALSYIDIWDIEAIKNIPNRELNKEIVDSILSSLDTLEDIKRIEPIHVVQGSKVGLNETCYGLVNGFHRYTAFTELYSRYLNEQGINPEELADNEELPRCLIPVIVRTNLNTREEIIEDRWVNNSRHGSPPTAKERRAFALYLADKYNYAHGLITHEQIGKLTGLHRSTVSKLLKKYEKASERASEMGGEDSEEGETTSASYYTSLTSYGSDMVNKIHLFFKHERAFFSLMGNSERDMRHRVKLISQEMGEKGYSPQEIYNMGMTLLSSYEAMTGKKVINRGSN